MTPGTAALALVVAWAAVAGEPAAFSSVAPGALPAGWEARGVRGVAPAAIATVPEADGTVLRVRSENAAGVAIHALRIDPAQRPMLSWRWKVDRVVAAADLARRDGDDFAARVYVFFDVPEEDLPWSTRLALGVARLFHREALPTAAICYVWDNRHPAGTSAWNPYTDRVRTVVVESGAARAGQWVEARRDLAADFRAAFGDGRVPAVTGIAAGNDTDQTGERATAWFGDFRFGPRP